MGLEGAAGERLHPEGASGPVLITALAMRKAEECLEGPAGRQPSSARDGLLVGASDTLTGALREERVSARGSAGGDKLGEAG